MFIEILRRPTPWWAETAAVNEDPYLTEYNRAMVKWEPSHLHALKLDRNLIYILRGPRQAGKTAFFKQLIRCLLLEKAIHPRNILYLNCEAAGPQKPQELAELLRDYLLWAKNFSKDRLHIFLDEATYLKDWERGAKTITDEGKLKELYAHRDRLARRRHRERRETTARTPRPRRTSGSDAAAAEFSPFSDGRESGMRKQAAGL